MPANMVLMNHDDGFVGRGQTAVREGLLDKRNKSSPDFLTYPG
jgi:hypothetical protein